MIRVSSFGLLALCAHLAIGCDAQAPEVARGPAFQFANSKRLVVAASEIEGSERVELEIELDLDEGEGSPHGREVKIASVGGRVLEASTFADPKDREGADRAVVRIDVESEFLETGAYLIQIESHRARPLDFRRYVLVVE